MNKARLEKLGKRLILVVAADELFEITYCTSPDKPEDCKTEHKTWDMCSEQERNLIYSQATKEHIRDQEIMLDEVLKDTAEDVSELADTKENKETEHNG